MNFFCVLRQINLRRLVAVLKAVVYTLEAKYVLGKFLLY